MLNRFLGLCVVIVTVVGQTACAGGQAKAVSQCPEIELNRKWAERAFSEKAAKSGSGLPFSFVYDGKPSSELTPKWKCKVTEKTDAGVVCRTLLLADDKTGLEVKAVATIYMDTPGVDWTVYFTNKGRQDAPVLEQVRAVDVRVKTDSSAHAVLHRIHPVTISNTGWTGTDYQPFDTTLAPGDKVEFKSPVGRTSLQGIIQGKIQGVFPFHNLSWGQGGVITAFGWSGQWMGFVERLDNRIRKYYLGDFFALTKVTTDPKDWCAMQYHRPEHADGMVLVFRRHDAAKNRKTLRLREIEASADYEVALSYGFKPSETVRMKGSKLKDIETEIADRPGSLLIEYKRAM